MDANEHIAKHFLALSFLAGNVSLPKTKKEAAQQNELRMVVVVVPSLLKEDSVAGALLVRMGRLSSRFAHVPVLTFDSYIWSPHSICCF